MDQKSRPSNVKVNVHFSFLIIHFERKTLFLIKTSDKDKGKDAQP